MVEKDPSVGLEEDRWVYLDLRHGKCLVGESLLKGRSGVGAHCDQGGGTRTWKQLFDGRLEPLSTLMRGKLRLVKGNMAELTAYVIASQQLMKTAMQIDTEIPEGLK